MKKVTINLTPEQQSLIHSKTGDKVQNFTYEALENRDAPKVAGGGLNDSPLDKGGGRPMKP